MYEHLYTEVKICEDCGHVSNIDNLYCENCNSSNLYYDELDIED